MADLKDSNYNIYKMVLTRLPYLIDDATTKAIVDHYTWEIMVQMEPCFQIAKQVTPEDPNRIGVEANYSMIQNMIIADLVAVYLLIRKALESSAGNSGADGGSTSTGTDKYISKTKAGSVEVEWKQYSDKNGVTLAAGFETLKDQYMKSAINRALSLGCVIDVNTGAVFISGTIGPDFLVFQSCETKWLI